MLDRWTQAPVGPGSELRVTRADCRTVLVVIPTMTAGARLRDLLSVFHGDHRIQAVYTVPESPASWHGTAEFVAAIGGLTIPWQQAINHEFDLVLAASHTGLEYVRGPILVVPHGASSLMSRKYSRSAGFAGLPHTGLSRETLTRRGRIIPAALGLTHDSEIDALRRSCPEALPVAVVAGDICYDRMAASMPMRNEYRNALGITDDQRLVTVSSTWSTDSVFGRYPDLCGRLLDEADLSFRIALVLHPSVSAVHGRWQVMTWLADCLERGLLLLPPEEGWRAALIASDWVIGDHGSTTQYAAAIDRRVTLGTYPKRAIRTGSIAELLAKSAPRLDLGEALLPQMRRVRSNGRHISRLLTSRPGRAAEILRRTMYDLLGLVEPEGDACLRPIPLPVPVDS